MRLAARLALIALIIGTATSAAATGRITLSLLASQTISWSFVVAVQLLTGLLLVRSATTPRIRALELYFDTHHFWSLWLLLFALLVLLLPNPGGSMFLLLATGAIPMALTARALISLARTHLGFTTAMARRRVLVHHAVTVALALIYGEYAGGILRRLVDIVTP